MRPRYHAARLALAFVALAVGCAAPPADAGAALVLEHEAGEHPPDASVTTATFHLANASTRPVRVLGFSTVCVEACCARVALPEPVTIPPGGRAAFTAELKVGKAGPFEVPLEVYYDDGALRTMPVPLKGTGRAGP